ncbi:Predicted arabinose efflux permease, MFS family [Alteromonadaceae bacterium Bs31]|nr:Predicted arabinose efflux permease, MFS family [Alteromonadaceae bacterium Bs31]
MFATLKQLPKNVWILAATLALVQGSMPLMVLVSGLLGAELAPSKSLATLPITLAVVGIACTTVPAALLAKKFGRKWAAYVGLLMSLLGIVACGLAAAAQNYSLLLVGSALTGGGGGFYQQFRFAAMESLSDMSNAGPALSVLMLSGIVAGVLGPELSTIGAMLLPHWPHYAPAFLLMALLGLLALVVLAAFENPVFKEQEASGEARSLGQIIKGKAFLIAMLAALLGYSMMVFLMTSTPISMHVHHGHSLSDAKWVIQSHVVAMYLPSLFSGFLIKRIGPAPLMISGSILYLLVIAVALSGEQVLHYWWSLVLLGVGWNFLFLCGTTLLPAAYKPSERFKVQAVNDFSIFSSQALASLLAGWILFQFGWQVQLLMCLPVALAALVISLLYGYGGSKRNQ